MHTRTLLLLFLSVLFSLGITGTVAIYQLALIDINIILDIFTNTIQILGSPFEVIESSQNVINSY